MSLKNDADDILQPLPVGEWPSLRDTLLRDWPTYAHYYYLVDNSIKWRAKDPSWECDYFCPRGGCSSGVFVSISTVPGYIVMPFAFIDSKELLFDCLTRTKRIDWAQPVMLRAIHESFDDVMTRAVDHVSERENLEIFDTRPTINYIKSRVESAAADIKVPADLSLRPLTLTHAALIFNLSPREEFKIHPDKSIRYLSTIISLNRSIGLFTKSTDELVSWALQNDWGGLGMLQTVEKYRGRGCARIVVASLAKMLAEDGIDTGVMIVGGNKEAETLFRGMGWKVTSAQRYIKVRPK